MIYHWYIMIYRDISWYIVIYHRYIIDISPIYHDISPIYHPYLMIYKSTLRMIYRWYITRYITIYHEISWYITGKSWYITDISLQIFKLIDISIFSNILCIIYHWYISDISIYLITYLRWYIIKIFRYINDISWKIIKTDIPTC